MDKKRISEILDEMGTLLELKGENPFRVRAYHNAAQIISGLTDNLTDLVKSKSLTSLKGIGSGLANIISELVEEENSNEYNGLREQFPTGILELLKVQGLGPKKVKVLYETLKIKSIAELKKACEENRLRSLDGFGTKTEENILIGIAHLERNSNKHLYPNALQSAEKIKNLIKSIKGVIMCDYAGSVRRCKELIGDVDILVSAKDAVRKRIIDVFLSNDEIGNVLTTGDTKASVRLRNGIQCDLRIVKDSEYPFALNYFTGSKEHNVEMRSLAKKKGLSLNEYGFLRIEKVKAIIRKCATENDIYKTLGMDYIPPELRENTGEIEYAQKNKIPDLVKYSDIRGTFHCHTTYSDGINTLEQIASTAKEMGWKYIGIADHSQAAAYAGGLSVEKLYKQIRQIDEINKRSKGFRVFKGIECDILPDGSLDYNDKVLAELDYVVISIHSKFKMTEEEATNRIVKALKNKYTTMLGHPTGRLLLEREGYPLNLPLVIQTASDYGKSIEINAHPMRLDLDWRYVKYAKEKGIQICINPDAHNIDGLRDVRYGIGIARKGWLEAKDVINTWTLKEVEKYFEKN